MTLCDGMFCPDQALCKEGWRGSVIGLCFHTATPGLAVKAGHLSKSAHFCELAYPAFWFYRAINQSPGKTKDLPQSTAISLGQKPKSQVHSRFCVVHRRSMNTRKGSDIAAPTSCLERQDLRQATSFASALQKNCWWQELSPPLFWETEEVSNRKLLQEDSDLWLTRTLISTHWSRMQAGDSDKIYTIANIFKLGVEENTEKANKWTVT